MNPHAADCHTHTIYCGHASEDMTVAKLLAAADAAGLRVVVITEHMHHPAHRGRVDRIAHDMRRVEHRCTAYLGAEIDADSRAADGTLVGSSDGLAYVIGSTHQYPGSDDWWYDKPVLSEAGRADVVRRWFEWAAAIVANPVVDALAHPGVFIAQNGLTTDYSGAVLDSFRHLFATAAAHGTLIEVNELAGRKLSEAHRATYPAVIRAAVEAGCQLVLGSDAHQPAAVGRFEWVPQVLSAAGVGPESIVLPTWRAEPIVGSDR